MGKPAGGGQHVAYSSHGRPLQSAGASLLNDARGVPLRAPADSYVQHIFAGGKETLTDPDVTPFMARQVSGNLVAIDPTYGLDADAAASTGSCAAACVQDLEEGHPRRLL